MQVALQVMAEAFADYPLEQNQAVSKPVLMEALIEEETQVEAQVQAQAQAQPLLQENDAPVKDHSD